MAFCSIGTSLTIDCGDEYPISGMGDIYIVPVNAIDETGVTVDATAHAFSAFATLSSEEWSRLEGKVDLTGLETENSKDGGGKVFTPTISITVPNITKARSFVMEKFGNQRVAVIATLNSKDSVTGNRNGVLIGYDNVTGKGAGANFTFNTQVQAEKGQMNGYVIEISGTQGESPRFVDFSITVDDGATGETVKFGAAV